MSEMKKVALYLSLLIVLAGVLAILRSAGQQARPSEGLSLLEKARISWIRRSGSAPFAAGIKLRDFIKRGMSVDEVIWMLGYPDATITDRAGLTEYVYSDYGLVVVVDTSNRVAFTK